MRRSLVWKANRAVGFLTCPLTWAYNSVIWKRENNECSFKERGGGQTFSTSFWMRFSQAPLCRYHFKITSHDIIFLLSDNIIEYICFWRFNSIIMTWNKWLVFTESVIMGLNNISSWPCPLAVVCLPCVITWLYSTPLPECEPLV